MTGSRVRVTQAAPFLSQQCEFAGKSEQPGLAESNIALLDLHQRPARSVSTGLIVWALVAEIHVPMRLILAPESLV